MLLVKIVLFEVLANFRTNTLIMNYGNTKNKKYRSRSNHQNLYDPFHGTGIFLYIPPESIRKPEVFLCSQGNRKRSVT